MTKKNQTKKRVARKAIKNTDIKPSKPKTSLTDLEKFYIESKCREGVDLNEIKTQNITPIALVEQLYNTTLAEVQEDSKMKAGKMFSRNENYGAVAMTQTASEIGDSAKAVNSEKKSEKKSHIHKFRQ